jgi:hypothetical protein
LWRSYRCEDGRGSVGCGGWWRRREVAHVRRRRLLGRKSDLHVAIGPSLHPLQATGGVLASGLTELGSALSSLSVNMAHTWEEAAPRLREGVAIVQASANRYAPELTARVEEAAASLSDSVRPLAEKIGFPLGGGAGVEGEETIEGVPRSVAHRKVPLYRTEEEVRWWSRTRHRKELTTRVGRRSREQQCATLDVSTVRVLDVFRRVPCRCPARRRRFSAARRPRRRTWRRR